MKPMWKVKGFEKQTLWKVSVLSFLPPLVVSSLSSFSVFFLDHSLCHVALLLCLVCGVCDTLKKPRVSVQNVPVCTGTTRTCVSTCARGAGTHADVLSGHTGFFSVYTTHAHTHTTTTTTDTTTDTTLRQRQCCRLPALVLNNFDIQSRRGYHYEIHGFSCRSPALVLNFSPH